MTIAVNTEFLLADYYEEYRYFLKDAFNQIAKQHSEHQFIFICRNDYKERIEFEKNVIPGVIKISGRHPLLFKWWYDIKIPAILKKYKADVFISCDGYMPLHTKISQCLFIYDLSFIHFPVVKRSQQSYLKKQIPKFLQNVNSVVTFSEYSKKDILNHYKINSEKINVVYTAAKNIFHPLQEDEKEMTRKKYTEGKNYFLYAGAIHPDNNLLNLLKAFSIFKKRQKSDWKLLLAGNLAAGYKDFSEKIRSYKHRGDVIWIENIEEQEMAKLIGSSYALIYPATSFAMPPLQAVNYHIPVIISADDIAKEKFGEAALYVDAKDHIDIADKMMLIYKDEEMRKKLIEKGELLTKDHAWNKTIDLLWQTILKAVH